MPTTKQKKLKKGLTNSKSHVIISYKLNKEMKGLVLIMTKKITRKEMFGMIQAVVANSTAANKVEMVEFIEKQIAQLERKSGSSKPTKTQLENENLKVEILECFKGLEKPVTITEFCEKVNHPVAELSNQKLSALFNQLAKPEVGKLIKTTEKKKSYFALA